MTIAMLIGPACAEPNIVSAIIAREQSINDLGEKNRCISAFA